MSAVFLATAAAGADPITAFLTRDWAALGGWSLFISLVILIVVGAFREWWVPGARHRRLEESSAEQSKTLSTTVNALDTQVRANEITKYFFEATVPKRGEPAHD